MIAIATVGVAEDSPYLPDSAGFNRDASLFLSKFCGDCHDGDADEGDFNVTTHLSADLANPAVAEKWSEVVNVLNSHQMPPDDSDQPSASEVADLVDWVTNQMMLAEQANRSAKVVIRRLNRAEYSNTVRDLMGVEVDVSVFPQDASAGGFDNNGSALSFSPLHTELFLRSAIDLLDRAFVTGPQPQRTRWRFEPESGDSDKNRVGYDDQKPIVNGGKNRVVGPGRLIRMAEWNTKITARDFRVPHAGPYVVRVRASSRVPPRDEVISAATELLDDRLKESVRKRPEGVDRLTRQRNESLQHFMESPIYDYGPARVRATVTLDGQPIEIGQVDVAGQGEFVELEFSVFMTTAKAGVTLQNAYHLPSTSENFWMLKDERFPRPELLVDWFEIEGPIHAQWPPASHSRWLPDELPGEELAQSQLAEDVLTRLMSLAYRRSVTKDEVQEKLRLYQTARRTSDSFLVGLKTAMASVLISPHFLYLAEPALEANARLSEDELASRLSYFLWSTMPDERLRAFARQGKLSDPGVRAKLVDVMLTDPRCEALIENFAGQWLGLRDVGSNPPAPDLFPRYDDHLETSMVQESKAFFREVLRNDLSLDCFLKSDFVMVNERLARFYDIKDSAGQIIRGDEMRRIDIAPSVPRGGVLTQGAFLTTTSNGTRTAPVKRGTWILKTLLDADPGLPVANAGEIAPKVPGIDKATVRQRLEIHRELPQCARCHDRIDPLGFALENFDASGQWRSREGFGYKGRVGPDDPKIDATGRLPDGTMIDGVGDLQNALLARRGEFHRSLATKMFSYALGREMTLTDKPQIDRAVGILSSYQATVRTLIKSVVTSESFTKR